MEVREGEVFMMMVEKKNDAGEEVEEDATFGALMGRGDDDGKDNNGKGYKEGYRKDNNEKGYRKDIGHERDMNRKGYGEEDDNKENPAATKNANCKNNPNQAENATHTNDQPISNYLPFALQRIRQTSRLWKLPLVERKRRVAECLEIPQETMKMRREFLFQRCVVELARHILNEVIEEEARGSVWFYMAIAKNVVEGKTRHVKVQYTSIDVKERKRLFLTYEAISMAIRLAFSPFSILHLDVNDEFIKVGVSVCGEGKRVEFRRFLEEYYRLSCLYRCLFHSISHGVCLFRFRSATYTR